MRVQPVSVVIAVAVPDSEIAAIITSPAITPVGLEMVRDVLVVWAVVAVPRCVI
jgi:hypothetical protein